MSRAVCDLPGWKPQRYCRRLRGQWQVATARDAAALVVTIEALAFECEVFPTLHCTGRSVTVVLMDPQAMAVTPAVLALAERLSQVVGPPGRTEPSHSAAVVATVLQELTSRPVGEPRAEAEEVEPVAGMMSLLATFEAAVRAFLPWIDKERAALAPLLPDEAEIERRAAADTLTRPMQLDRDAGLLAARLEPLLALLRTAQVSDDTHTEKPSDAPQRPMLDSTEDLTPFLRPNPKPEPSK